MFINNNISYKVFTFLFLLLLIFLQYELWLGSCGILTVKALANYVCLQEKKNTQLIISNYILYKEILQLRNMSHNQLLEGIVRNNLGLIKKGEIFYHIN